MLERADYCCEYCRCCESVSGQALHVDHIDPSRGDIYDNLCAACAACNGSKWIAVNGTDPTTGEVVLLFNPRIQNWHEHFEWLHAGLIVAGRTPTGRATVDRLRMNRNRSVRARRSWIAADVHPPKSTSSED
ncbi:MAG: HNH endonuclease [Chloroflexi bacterium]|nr:HNH endonuclease [Chloroflexota bacterium]